MYIGAATPLLKRGFCFFMTYHKPEAEPIGTIDRWILLTYIINVFRFIHGLPLLGGIFQGKFGVIHTDDGGPAESEYIGRDN